MPKPDVLFTATMTEESDDEIEIIPYVKPPPVVIDIIESEDEAEKEEKKKSKKKSKKYKRRDQEGGSRGSREDDTSRNDSLPTASLSSACTKQNEGDPKSTNNNVRDGVVQEVIASHAEDSERGLIHESNALSESRNVAGNVSSNPTSSPRRVSLSSNNGAPSSGSEKCTDAQSKHAVGLQSSTMGDNMARTTNSLSKTPNGPKNKNCDSASPKPRQRRSKKDDGKSRTRVSAARRTNEEIVNFLTTLGIQMEPTVFESESPTKRRRQPRKRQQSAEVESDATNPSVAGSSSNHDITDRQNLGSGKEFSSPQKKKRKSNSTKALNTSPQRKQTTVSPQKPVSAASTSVQRTPNTVSSQNRQPATAASTTSQKLQTTVSTPVPEAGTSSSWYLSVVPDVIQAVVDKSKDLRSDFSSPERKKKRTESDSSTTASTQETTSSLDIQPSASSENAQSTPSISLVHPIASSDNTHTMDTATKFQTHTSPEKAQVTSSSKDAETVSSSTKTRVTASSENAEVTGSSSKSQATTLTKNVELTGSAASTENAEGNGTSSNTQATPSLENADVTVTVSASKTPAIPVSENADITSSKNRTTVSSEKVQASTTSTPTQKSKTCVSSYKGQASASQKGQASTSQKGQVSASPKGQVSASSKGQVSASRKLKSSAGTPVADPVPLMAINVYPPIQPPSNAVKSKSRCEHPESRENSSRLKNAPPPVLPHADTFNFDINNEYDPAFPNTWTPHMREFYGENRRENFEIDDVWFQLSNNSRLWRAPLDMMPPPRNKRNYKRCDRCKQIGHFLKDCTEKWKPPLCHMCGKEGHTSDHRSLSNRSPKCPDARCLNCGQQLYQYSQQCTYCLLQRKPKRCELCNVVGHNKSVCPDNWRRYHSITSEEDYKATKQHPELFPDYREIPSSVDPAIYKNQDSLFCSNCGMKGHLYYFCYKSRWNPYSRHKPFAIVEMDLSVLSKLPPPSSTAVSDVADVLAPSDTQPSTAGLAIDAVSERIIEPTKENDSFQVRIMNDKFSGTTNPISDDISSVKSGIQLTQPENQPPSIVTDPVQNEETPAIVVEQSQKCANSENKVDDDAQVEDDDDDDDDLVILSQPEKADKDGQVDKLDSPAKSDSEEIIELPLTPKPEANIEVITIDDEDDDNVVLPSSTTVSGPSSSNKIASDPNKKIGRMEITLLASEWKLVSTEFSRPDNIFSEISRSFEVDLTLSKESSSVIVTEGSNKRRQMAKDNVVFWLECKSSKSEFKFLPKGYEELRKAQKRMIKSGQLQPTQLFSPIGNSILGRACVRIPKVMYTKQCWIFAKGFR